MKTYTVEQAAEALQVNADTIRRLARTGALTGSKIGNHWRFTERDLEAFLERQRPPQSKRTIEADLSA